MRLPSFGTSYRKFKLQVQQLLAAGEAIVEIADVADGFCFPIADIYKEHL